MESKKAFAKEAGEDIIGKNAQVITRMSKALASLTRQNECSIILINQPRAPVSGGYSDLSAGPRALQHATTAKITMRLIGGADGTRKMKFGDSEEPVSKQVRAIVERLKYGTEGRRAEFWFNVQETAEYGPVGVNAADEYATMGIRYGVIAREGKGSWYVVPGADKVNGQPAVRKLLLARPELLEAVRAGVLAADPEAAANTDSTED
jgi:RecA/RadA recombinase